MWSQIVKTCGEHSDLSKEEWCLIKHVMVEASQLFHKSEPGKRPELQGFFFVLFEANINSVGVWENEVEAKEVGGGVVTRYTQQ